MLEESSPSSFKKKLNKPTAKLLLIFFISIIIIFAIILYFSDLISKKPGFLRIIDDFENIAFLTDPLIEECPASRFSEGNWIVKEADGRKVLTIQKEEKLQAAFDLYYYSLPEQIWQIETEILFPKGEFPEEKTYAGLVFWCEYKQKHALVLENTEDPQVGKLRYLILTSQGGSYEKWQQSVKLEKNSWQHLSVHRNHTEFTFYLNHEEIHRFVPLQRVYPLDVVGFCHYGNPAYFSNLIISGSGNEPLYQSDFVNITPHPLVDLIPCVAKRMLKEKVISKYSCRDTYYVNQKQLKDPHFIKANLNMQSGNCILAPVGTIFEYKVKIPKHAYLEFGIGVLEEAWVLSNQNTDFTIEIQSSFGKSKTPFSGLLNPAIFENDRGWNLKWLDLKPWADKYVTLRFITKPKLNLPADPLSWAAWSNPTIVWGDSRKDGDANLLLISLDTLRADHLGCYGRMQWAVSPYLDQLALQSTLFSQTVSQAPWTTPSHLSIMTSLYPVNHGITGSEYTRQWARMDDRCLTLAEVLQPYRATVAFTGTGPISGIFGFNEGFSLYVESSNDLEKPHLETLKRAQNWLKHNYSRRFFMFLHSYEPHSPYENDFFYQLLPPSKRIGFQVPLAYYDGDIRSTDNWVREIIKTLENLQILDETIIIITSDHGEDFDDHAPLVKTKGHGHSLYDDLLLVPLLIRYPKKIPQNLIIQNQIRSIDIAPTALELLGMPIPEEFVGQSLLTLIGNQNSEDRIAYSEGTLAGPLRYSLRTGNRKYIFTPDPKQTFGGYSVSDKVNELYDLEKDPTEKKDLAPAEPLEVKTSKEAIEKTLFTDTNLYLRMIPDKDKLTSYSGILGTTGVFVKIHPFDLEFNDKIEILEDGHLIKFSFETQDNLDGFSVELDPLESSVNLKLFEKQNLIDPSKVFLGTSGNHPNKPFFTVTNENQSVGVTSQTPRRVALQSSPGYYIWWFRAYQTKQLTPSQEELDQLRALGYVD